jgi:hypothetical protein
MVVTEEYSLLVSDRSVGIVRLWTKGHRVCQGQ